MTTGTKPRSLFGHGGGESWHLLCDVSGSGTGLAGEPRRVCGWLSSADASVARSLAWRAVIEDSLRRATDRTCSVPKSSTVGEHGTLSQLIEKPDQIDEE